MVLSARKFKPESAPLARNGFDPGSAAEPLNRFRDNGQANAGAWKLLHRTQSFKEPENSFPVRRRDANTVVLDTNSDPLAALLGVNLQFRPGVGSGEFKRIRQQVGKDMN